PATTPPTASPPPAPTTVNTTSLTPTSPPVTVSASDLQQQIIDLVNQERAAAGLGPVTVNAKLVQAAQIHADDMARLDQMNHTLQGVPQPTLQSRADFVGYQFAALGENIAYNYRDAAAVMEAWMASPGHRANILYPGFTEIGVAVAWNAYGEPYYCQVFGAPAS
ncbi:MAG: CAP domain-containing protein, partial [Isosphaeraceae bacterium]|nr:CAP domain-containing protein [Isosphaeraceae bacterium]